MREYLGLPRSVYVLCIGSLINRAGSFVLIFLTVYVSEKLGFGQAFAALCMGAFGLGSIFGSLTGGQLADQFGRKVVMASALLGGAALVALLAIGDSRPFILGVMLAYGLVAEMFRPACMAMLSDVTEPSQRPAAFGLLYISINLGFAMGPPIGGFLAAQSYSLLFWGDAVTMAIFGAIVLLGLSESRGLLEKNTEQPPRDVPVAEAARHILTDRPFILFCVATFLVNVLFMQCMVTLPMHIKGAGYSMTELGWLMSVNGVMIVICQLPLTHALERFNPMANITIGGVLIVIGFGAYCLPAAVPLLVIATVFWTVGEMMQAPFKQTVVTNLAPLELRARYMGAFGMCFSVALTLGAPLGGYMLAEFGTRALWGGGACLAAVGVGLYCVAYRAVSARSAAAVAADDVDGGREEPSAAVAGDVNPYREPARTAAPE